jgi:secreted protein with Ig-like and vWFA domain
MMIDSVGPNNYSGRMSGLLDADFNTVKITQGRFDHTLNQLQISF